LIGGGTSTVPDGVFAGPSGREIVGSALGPAPPGTDDEAMAHASTATPAANTKRTYAVTIRTTPES